MKRFRDENDYQASYNDNEAQPLTLHHEGKNPEAVKGNYKANAANHENGQKCVHLFDHPLMELF
ncbi:MAG TPA: hypothetical protein VMS08_01145 [Candidatus Saccharimonadia bacterium]|nr:hypothetical protein [Candidatus Saccharimonadia bacterium]